MVVNPPGAWTLTAELGRVVGRVGPLAQWSRPGSPGQALAAIGNTRDLANHSANHAANHPALSRQGRGERQRWQPGKLATSSQPGGPWLGTAAFGNGATLPNELARCRPWQTGPPGRVERS